MLRSFAIVVSVILHCYTTNAHAGLCPGSDLHKAGIEPFLQVNAFIFCGNGIEVSAHEYRASSYDVVDIHSKKSVLSFSKQQTTYVALKGDQLNIETFYPLPTGDNWGLKQYPHYRYALIKNKFIKNYIFQTPMIPKKSLRAAQDMLNDIDESAKKVQQLSSILLLAALNKSSEAEKALFSLNKRVEMDVYHLAVHKQNVTFLKEHKVEKNTSSK